jgi:hypothetical protein
MFLNICNQEKNVVSLHQKKKKIHIMNSLK